MRRYTLWCILTRLYFQEHNLKLQLTAVESSSLQFQCHWKNNIYLSPTAQAFRFDLENTPTIQLQQNVFVEKKMKRSYLCTNQNPYWHWTDNILIKHMIRTICCSNYYKNTQLRYNSICGAIRLKHVLMQINIIISTIYFTVCWTFFPS